MPEFSDPKELWLEPACAGDERCWCADKMDDCAETGCGLPAPKYLRADLVETETATLRAENERLRSAIINFEAWLQQERMNIGAVDGYDYRSGEEYGLRCAEIEFRKVLRAALTESSPDKPDRMGNGIAAEPKADIDIIIRDLCELPDDVEPEQDGALTVTVDELRIILTRHLDPEHA